MVPFADYVNHENVDTGFDCVDEQGISYDKKLDKDDTTAQEKYLKCQEQTRDSVMNMKRDMLEIEIELREKMLAAGCET